MKILFLAVWFFIMGLTVFGDFNAEIDGIGNSKEINRFPNSSSSIEKEILGSWGFGTREKTMV